MPKMYTGVNNLSKLVNSMYIGVNNVAKRVVKGYVGVNGLAKIFFDGDEDNLVKFTSYGQFYCDYPYQSTVQATSFGDFNYIDIFCVGGGGGGAGGFFLDNAENVNNHYHRNGTAGASGNTATIQNFKVYAGQSFTAHIGAGGRGGYGYDNGQYSFDPPRKRSSREPRSDGNDDAFDGSETYITTYTPDLTYLASASGGKAGKNPYYGIVTDQYPLLYTGGPEHRWESSHSSYPAWDQAGTECSNVSGGSGPRASGGDMQILYYYPQSGGGEIANFDTYVATPGNHGSDGGNGQSATEVKTSYDSTFSYTHTLSGGTGQGRTTREFGNSGRKLYASIGTPLANTGNGGAENGGDGSSGIAIIRTRCIYPSYFDDEALELLRYIYDINTIPGGVTWNGNSREIYNSTAQLLLTGRDLEFDSDNKVTSFKPRMGATRRIESGYYTDDSCDLLKIVIKRRLLSSGQYGYFPVVSAYDNIEGKINKSNNQLYAYSYYTTAGYQICVPVLDYNNRGAMVTEFNSISSGTEYYNTNGFSSWTLYQYPNLTYPRQTEYKDLKTILRGLVGNKGVPIYILENDSDQIKNAIYLPPPK